MHFFHYDMYFFVIAIAFFLEIPHNKCKEVISEVHGMKNSICRFVPEGSGKEVKTLNFVFETQFRTLRQPFIRPYYVLNIVTDGVAYIKCGERKEKISRGDVFMFFPACPYEIEEDEGFEYMYISFFGQGVPSLLEECGIKLTTTVYSSHERLLPILFESINRLTPKTAGMLTESMLLLILSYVADNKDTTESAPKSKAFCDVLEYVDLHYRDSDMSLKRLSEVFSYTDKYISSLFKANLGIGFKIYLNSLRIRYAQDLARDRRLSVAEIASESGFSDSLYFSKAFKKHTGKTPSEFIKLTVNDV